MLGALSQFSRTYRQPIEAKTPEQLAKVDELRALIQPQILHRLKTDVATDLPQAGGGRGLQDVADVGVPATALRRGAQHAA